MARRVWIAATLAFMGLTPGWLGLQGKSPVWLLLVSAAVVATRRPIGVNYNLLREAQERGHLQQSVVSVFVFPWLVIAALLIAPYAIGHWIGVRSAG